MEEVSRLGIDTRQEKIRDIEQPDPIGLVNFFIISSVKNFPAKALYFFPPLLSWIKKTIEVYFSKIVTTRSDFSYRKSVTA